MSTKLVYTYASATTHKGIPMVTASKYRTGQTRYSPSDHVPKQLRKNRNGG